MLEAIPKHSIKKITKAEFFNNFIYYFLNEENVKESF